MLTIVTPPAVTALCTVDAVKAAVSVTGTDDDAFIGDLVSGASSDIATMLGRTMGRARFRQTERLSEWVRFISLECLPFAELHSAQVDGAAIDLSLCEADASRLFRLDATDCRVPWCGKVVLEYSAGWLLPGQTGRTLPAAIERACIDLVVMRYSAKGRAPLLRAEQTDGVGRWEYQIASGMAMDGGMPADIAARLAGYVTVSV